MNKITVLLSCVLVLLLTSCQFTEEITFNSDGSGEFIMHYDMSQMMIALKEMSGKTDTESEEKKKTKIIDSTIYFKDMLDEKADSISKLPEEDQQKLKDLETVVMKMKMNEATNSFMFGFGSTFKSLNELEDVLTKIEKAKKLNSKDNQQFNKVNSSAVAKSTEKMLEHVDFKYSGNTFTRTIKIDTLRTDDEVKAVKDEMASLGAEAETSFKAMTYNLVYHFPKKIASVTNKNAVISDDGKTVTLTMNFLDMIAQPEHMNLSVKLVD